ncbi:MAG: 3-oxoacyl-(acyl-carrier-protein) reductase FabG [Firmicutes bacterium]|nr:3-oxoacyl-(acyl-carrier-protein) reductase FabG [Bacillota bacterium]
MRLQDKVAGVTGAGMGIGRAICLALAAEGARVAVTDLNFDWASQVVEEIEARGGEAIALKLDVTQATDIVVALKAIVDRQGRIDIWCNNAGVSTMNCFVDLTEKDWDCNMNVNAKGVFLCSQAVARQMVQQEPNSEGIRGKIINTASMAGKRGAVPFLAHYVASKFAVVGLTQAMAVELAPHGITVNAVCPGYVETSMQEQEVTWEARLRGISEEEVCQLYINDTPLRRLERPEDVAKVVVFLASDLAQFITGEAINVNGGAFMD